MHQARLFNGGSTETATAVVEPLRTQFLKWVGNKQRVAHRIIAYFPAQYGTYFEPFLGSGAVLGTLAPTKALASDACKPLVGIWTLLRNDPERLLSSYEARWGRFQIARHDVYEAVKADFNRAPNSEDLLFLCRSCYGGVIRFRKDGYMSTPIGVHDPISPASLSKRIKLWSERTRGADFATMDFEEAIDRAGPGDIVYCDPPYSDTQAILYGSQAFSLERLFEVVRRAKARGVRVAVSLDGHKRSGAKVCDVSVPAGLFPRDVAITVGRSMLRRFQMKGDTLESEVVADRLLLSW